MTTIVRCVVTDSAIYKQLHAELKDAFPDESVPLKYKDLEGLPYLMSLWDECIVWQLPS